MRKIYLILTFIIIVLGGVFIFENDILKFFPNKSLELPEMKSVAVEKLAPATEKISTPPPLRVAAEASPAVLTRSGVIKFVNIEREKYSLPRLEENAELNISAGIKTKDMLDNQYFTHVSPSGTGVGDVAKIAGYKFIKIGENLALGNFKDDQALVNAWMNSPGHRANILNGEYRQIGVSVIKGVFEGGSTWFAVQHFGFPLSACPSIDSNLKTEISSSQSLINGIQKELNALESEIQNMLPLPGLGYNQKVESYNNLVTEYNNLLIKTDDLVSQYNNQVKEFNKCAGDL